MHSHLSTGDAMQVIPTPYVPITGGTENRALRAQADCYYAVERGAIKDLFGAYGRLCAHLGREIADVEPKRTPAGDPLVALSKYRDRSLRRDVIDSFLMPAMRQQSASAWRYADSVMRGLALAESVAWTQAALESERDRDRYTREGQLNDADLSDRMVTIRLAEGEFYLRLAMNRVWVL